VFGSSAQDLTITRSPTLRNLFKPNGTLNGRLMHDASFSSVEAVIEHYNSGIQLNPNLDPKLKPGGNPIRLNLNATQKAQVLAFLKTLSGVSVYTDQRWSDPF
jgi:cytochrome c peroxidase